MPIGTYGDHHCTSFISTALIFYYLYTTLDLAIPARFFLVSGIPRIPIVHRNIVGVHLVLRSWRNLCSGLTTRRGTFFHPTQQFFKICIGRRFRGNWIVGTSVGNQGAVKCTWQDNSRPIYYFIVFVPLIFVVPRHNGLFLIATSLWTRSGTKKLNFPLN